MSIVDNKRRGIAPLDRTTAPGPVSPAEVSKRSLAPDFARGAMLLLIAVANAHLFLYQRPIGVRSYPIAESAAERIAVLVPMTLVDGREFPLFAFLFGYGAVQLRRRLIDEGAAERDVLRLLRRRGWWMVPIGFAHGLLLFSGDVIAAYGLSAVVLAVWLIRASDRTLLVVAGAMALPITAIGAWDAYSTPVGAAASVQPLASLAIADPLAAMGSRVGEWVGLTVLTALFGTLPAMLVGVWAARRRILEEPARHRALLNRTAVLGLGLACFGGLPLAATAALWSPGWSPTVGTAWAGMAHHLTGYAGGIGYAAVAGLVAIRLGHRPGRLARAITACGQRSMTCYLFQSAVWVAVLAAYGGGLGNRFGLPATALLATATWAAGVVLAEAMSRRGYRGPAETLLRRLAYRQVS